MTEPAPKLTPSRNTRIAGDLGDKLDELLVVLGLTAAEYLDPLIRRQVENDYKANGAAIRAMKAARARAAKLRDESPELVNDLGGES
jgi:hypothetical protein